MASKPTPPASLADRARDVARRVNRLPHDVVASFENASAEARVSHLQDVTAALFYDALPVVRWLERHRPADTAAELLRRLTVVFSHAVGCASFDTPEYAGGTITRNDGKASEGALLTARLVVMANQAAVCVDEWAGVIEVEEQPVIWHHGGRSYSSDGANPVTVTHEEGRVLQAFLRAGRSLETRELEDGGVTNVARVVGQLLRRYGGRFAPAIRTPKGVKGGGYFIRVRAWPSR